MMHATLADWMLEPVSNAIEAGARAIRVHLSKRGSWIEAEVADDGPGLDRAHCDALFDPFAGGDPRKHPARRPHLGLPLLHQIVQQAGGELAVESMPGQGTLVRLALDTRHPDAPPAGDWAAAIATSLAMAAERGIAMQWLHEDNGRLCVADNLDLLGAPAPIRADRLQRLRHELAENMPPPARAPAALAVAGLEENRSWAN
ncbi:MAG: ATP-binding protein [Kiritimatiellae bacterium]|nr:ATP-binding protein [Kiritimatiellia bacterium]